MVLFQPKATTNSARHQAFFLKHSSPHTDSTGKWGMVDVRALRPVLRPVPLAAIRAEKRLKDLALVRHTRLSVMPVAAEEWRVLCEMAGVKP